MVSTLHEFAFALHTQGADLKCNSVKNNEVVFHGISKKGLANLHLVFFGLIFDSIFAVDKSVSFQNPDTGYNK
jgi:hypothetical protein